MIYSGLNVGDFKRQTGGKQAYAAVKFLFNFVKQINCSNVMPF